MDNLLLEFEKYLNERYSSNNTIKSYLLDVKQFLRYFLTNFGEELLTFSRGYISEYKEHLINDKDSKFTTINRKLASISIYENFLIEKGVKKEKCIRERDFYKIDIPYITANMLPNKAIKKVILKSSTDNIRDYMILILMAEGGLRVSEVLGIEIKRDIDFEMRRVVVLGKGNKVRYILMNEIIKDALDEYLPEREKILNGRKNKYLIISNESANTGKQIHRSLVNKILNKYCEKVKETEINPHMLRHLYATTKYQEGYNDMMLKKTLGQTSNVTNRYVHPGYEEETAKRIREKRNMEK